MLGRPGGEGHISRAKIFFTSRLQDHLASLPREKHLDFLTRCKTYISKLPTHFKSHTHLLCGTWQTHQPFLYLIILDLIYLMVQYICNGLSSASVKISKTIGGCGSNPNKKNVMILFNNGLNLIESSWVRVNTIWTLSEEIYTCFVKLTTL